MAAMKAFAKALKVASADDISAGVDRYIRNKPEWQAFCHPETFLNQGRWMDEYEDRRTGDDRRDGERGTLDRRHGLEWIDECKVLHNWECGSEWRHHQRITLAAMKGEKAS